MCGKTLGRENEEKDRNDDDAAADPKEARKNSGDHPEGRIHQPFRHRVFSRNMNFIRKELMQ
jgi:hypothetical protein